MFFKWLSTVSPKVRQSRLIEWQVGWHVDIGKINVKDDNYQFEISHSLLNGYTLHIYKNKKFVSVTTHELKYQAKRAAKEYLHQEGHTFVLGI